MRAAVGCGCGHPLFFTDEPEHCAKCGRGPFTAVYAVRAPRRRRLPWDLGALQREGRRPDPHLENVVRFDRLRPGPRSGPVEFDVVEEVTLRPGQERVLSLAADGLSNQQIANLLGKPIATVQSHLSQAYRAIGLEVGSSTRAAAIAWWRSTFDGRLAA